MKSDQQFEFWIVTPSYNQAEFIEQTIQSVLNQLTGAIRYLVMDGGSKDQTVTILKKYSQKLQWVSEKDAGQTDAINKGLRWFQHQTQRPLMNPEQVIVAYINSDDYYLPAAFEKVAVAFAQHPDKKWVVGDCQIVNKHGLEIQKPVRMYKQILRQIAGRPIMAITNPIPQPAVFMRLSAVMKVGYFNTDLRYVMDYEYWLRLLSTFGTPQYLGETLAAFRIHGQSKGGSQFTRQFAEEYQVAQQFFHNPLLLFLHRLHTLMIVTVYRLIK